MTSFTNGVELIDPRCLLGKHEKAAPAIGCRPFAFLHIGTICLEVRIRSAALIFLARHKTAILGATLLLGDAAARRDRQPACPLADRGRGVASPHLRRWCGSLVLRVGEVLAHPPPGSPRYARSRRYSVVERINSSHIPRTFGRCFLTPYIKHFANIFSWTSNPAG